MIRNLLKQSLNLLLPPLCSLCKTPVNESQKVCGTCFGKLTFIQEPFCCQCGLPFEFKLGANPKCTFCLQSPPNYELMRSVFTYDELVKKLILGFKHGDRTDFLPLLANWMASLYRNESQLSADLIIPIPIHGFRLIKRRYNQAALLAQYLGKVLNLPVNNYVLKRHLKTPPQAGNRENRRKNVKSAFSIREKDLVILKGKTILLIDDVVTTGATIEACARTLKNASVAEVKVLSLARVVL